MNGASLDRSTWRTPRELAALLGYFTVDVCSPGRWHPDFDEGSYIAASHHITEQENGLSVYDPGAGTRRWCNPPYKGVLAWVEKWSQPLASTWFLTRLDPGTAWGRALRPNARELLLPPGRIAFEPPPGVRASSNPFPHAITVTGQPHHEDRAAIDRLVTAGWQRYTPREYRA